MQITFDCADPAGLAAFRAEVLGYQVQPLPGGFDSGAALDAARTLSEIVGGDQTASDAQKLATILGGARIADTTRRLHRLDRRLPVPPGRAARGCRREDRRDDGDLPRAQWRGTPGGRPQHRAGPGFAVLYPRLGLARP